MRSPVKSWRWILVVGLLAGIIGFLFQTSDRAPAQSGPANVQILDSSGNPGTFTAPIAVAFCRYANASLDYEATIDVPIPTASAITGQPDQSITWEPRLYQATAIWPNGQILRTGAVQSQSLASGSTTFTRTSLTGLPQGPAYIAGGVLTWKSGDTVLGSVEFVFLKHDSFRETTIKFASGLSHCSPLVAATVALSTYRTTVNVTVHLSGRYFPISAPVSVTWKGAPIAQVMSDAGGNVSASIRVPAAPLGDYRLGFDAGSLWRPAATLTVVPRIKVIPGTAERGETVKISLRGFAKKEWVRIRWRQDGAWVEVGWIYTSNTGSGELWIPVPAGAADGGNSVRGDGPNARAQTNAVTISGGPSPALASEAPEPTPAPPLAATPEPEPDQPPATPGAESTAEPALDATPIPESP